MIDTIMTAKKYCSHDSLFRALLWLQQSPPLFSPKASRYIATTALPETIPLYTPDQQALECLKAKLDPLPWLPLGIYYENLWHFLIRQLPELELLSHNLQVIRNNQESKITLGEYDIIYRFNHQVFHRELAVKFYLGVPLSKSSHSPRQHWVGPGLKDRLDRKMQRLCNHQILLSDTAEGQQALAEFNSNLINKEILVQGRIFYPMFADCPPPLNVHPDHLRGYWLTISEYRHWLSAKSVTSSCQILAKPFWLDNNMLNNSVTPKEHLIALNQIRLPQMVKHHDQFMFVAPDDWPEQAIRCAEQT